VRAPLARSARHQPKGERHRHQDYSEEPGRQCVDFGADVSAGAPTCTRWPGFIMACFGGDVHMREQRIRLEHHIDRPRRGRQCSDIDAVDQNMAVFRGLPGNHPQQGRLAAARRPKQRKRRAALDGQRHVVNRDDGTETLAYPGDFEQCNSQRSAARFEPRPLRNYAPAHSPATPAGRHKPAADILRRVDRGIVADLGFDERRGHKFGSG